MATRKKQLRYGAGALACLLGMVGFLLYQNEHARKITWISPGEAQLRMTKKSGLEKASDFLLRRWPDAHNWMIRKLRNPLIIEAWTFQTPDLEQAFKLQTQPTTNQNGMRAWVLSAKDFNLLTNVLVTNPKLKNTSSCVYTASGVTAFSRYPSFVVAGTVATNTFPLRHKEFDYIVCDLNSFVRFNSVTFDSMMERSQGAGYKGLAGIEVTLRKGEALLVDTDQRLNGGENCWFVFGWQKN